MKIRCRHCGTPNAFTGGDPGVEVCSICGRDLGTTDNSILDQSSPSNRGSGLGSEGSFEPVGWSADTTDAPGLSFGTPKISVNPTSETLSPSDAMRLGPLPTADDSIDLSAILEGTSSTHGAGSISAPQAQPKSNRGAPSGPDAETGWRIRTARGVVYEMETEGDVVQRISDWTDLSTVEIARGLGPFLAVDAYPQFQASEQTEESLGSASSSNVPDFLVDVNPAVFSNTHDGILKPQVAPVDESPSLDYDRASERHAGTLRKGRTDPALRGPVVSQAVASTASPHGFRSVAVIIALVLMGAIGFLEFSGSGGVTQPVKAKTTEGTQRDSKRLRMAIHAMDSGNYTTAAQVLERLAQRSKDPQVFRHLAAALHRTNRQLEAERALETYRELSKNGSKR